MFDCNCGKNDSYCILCETPMRCKDCAADDESLGSEDSERESVDPDEFEENDSDISDGGESDEPSDGETLDSEDSERSNDSEGEEDEDEEEIVYDSAEDELDRLDAIAEKVAKDSKRRRVIG